MCILSFVLRKIPSSYLITVGCSVVLYGGLLRVVLLADHVPHLGAKNSGAARTVCATTEQHWSHA